MIALTPEGVAALESMAAALDQGAGEITEACNSIIDEIEVMEGIGTHRTSIVTCVETIRDEISQASHPASELSERLEEKAKEYQEFIDTDRFSS